MYVIKLPCCLSRAGFGSPLTTYCLNPPKTFYNMITNENMSKSTVNFTSLGSFDRCKITTRYKKKYIPVCYQYVLGM